MSIDLHTQRPGPATATRHLDLAPDDPDHAPLEAVGVNPFWQICQPVLDARPPMDRDHALAFPSARGGRRPDA